MVFEIWLIDVTVSQLEVNHKDVVVFQGELERDEC